MTTIHQRGYRRDRAIVELLESCGALDTDQIHLLLFQDVSKRVTQRRLKTLREKKLVKADRLTVGEPSFYYLGKRPGQVDHTLALNWVYTWTIRNLRSWEKLHSFSREIDYKILRSDGFIAIQNLVASTWDFSFIEMDIAESGNAFDKVEKYTALYDTDGYYGSWWQPLAQKFPRIILVTTNIKRYHLIKEKVRVHNIRNLRFSVYTLDQVKEECSNGSCSTPSLRAE